MPQNLFDDNDFLIDLFNSIPFAAFVVDGDLCVLFWNSAAGHMIVKKPAYASRCGEILRCIHSKDVPEGCGHGSFCENCIIRNSVNQAIQGGKVFRKRTVLEPQINGKAGAVPVLVTSSPFKFDGRLLSLLILEDIGELMQLGSLLPICSKCKKIRTGDNEWEPVERFIRKHIIEVDFTHGLCPVCLRETFPERTSKRAIS